MPLSPLAANLRRCYSVARPPQDRVNHPAAGNDLFAMYLAQLSRVGGKTDAQRPMQGNRVSLRPEPTRKAG